jgi:hypothetical protein
LYVVLGYANTLLAYQSVDVVRLRLLVYTTQDEVMYRV